MSVAMQPAAVNGGPGSSAFPGLVHDGFSRVLRPVDAIFGAYMLVLTLLALGAWQMGTGALQSVLVFGAFLAANLAFSSLSRRSGRRTRVEAARIAAGALLAPAAYLLAGDPFMRWWPGFLILCLGGSIFVSLHSSSPRLGRLIAAYYAALLAASEFLAPAPHDWYMLAINAGAVAMVGLLFAELVAMLGTTLAAEREQRAQLAAEKARSETMLQKEAADTLRASEERFRTLIEISADPIAVVDAKGVIRYASPAYERQLGHAPEELVGRPYRTLIHPDDFDGMPQVYERLLRDPGRLVNFEYRIRDKSGKWHVAEGSAKLSPDGNVVVYSHDVTERKRAEAAMRAIVEGTASATGSDFFQSLVRHLAKALEVRYAFVAEAREGQARTIALWSGDGPGENIGYPLAGSPCETVVSSRQLCHYPQSVRELFPQDAILVDLGVESYMGFPLLGASGEALGHLVVMDDRPMSDEAHRAEILQIFAARAGAELERQQADAKLRANEAHLQLMLENAFDFTGVVAMDGTYRSVSPNFEKEMGWSTREMIGRNFVEMIHPDDLPRIMPLFQQLFAVPGAAIRSECRVQHKDGTWRWLDNVGQVGPDGCIVAKSRDITERKRAEEALRRLNAELEQRVRERTAAFEAALAEQRRFAAIIQATSDYVGIADLQGRSVFVNQAGLRMVGKTRENMEGASVAACYPQREQAKVGEMVGAALGGKIWSGEITLRHTAGREIPVSEVTFALPGADGKPEYLATIIRDIGPQKRTEAELKQAKEAAEAANRAKSAFLATMSHEIRTPMNAVIGMTSLLLETPLSPRQRDFVETIRTGGDSLLTVINDILDFSKIEADKLDLVPKPFALRESVEAVLDLLAPRAGEKGLEVAYLLEEGVPAGIVGDVTRLRQILVNLVGNAIKFTTQGEVVISVSARALGAAAAGGALRHELQFSVRDTGPGIPADQMSRLFQSFSQLDSSATREHGGTGLGLAISRRLAELMGGRMWVESEGNAGRGSTFHFTIVAEEAAAAGGSRLRSGVLPELRGRRLLIVDDNATNRRILALQARGWGMEPVEAATASEALQRVRSGEPLDLAILDMHLPAPAGAQDAPADGVALAYEICSLRGARRLPLVMLTSVGITARSEAESIRCFEAWLTKPVKPSQLYDVLVEALAPGSASLTTDAQTGQASPATPLADRLPLRILVAEDVALNQKFALLALEQMGYRADIAGNGLETIAALVRQPYDVVLMDVQMPELDGLEATRRIRSGAGAGRQPYIVAMTANAMQGDRETCLQAGMDDYVSKPVYLAELRAALERAGRARQPAPAAEHAAPPAAHSMRGPVDPGAVAELLRRADGAGLIALYAEEASRYASALRRAFDQGDPNGLQHAAHDLKGCSGYVGADRLVGLCRQLEQEGRAGSLENAARLVAETEKEIERVREALSALCAA